MSRHWYWSAPSRGVVVVETHRVPRFSDTSVFDHDGSCIRHGQLRHLCLLCPPVGQQTRKPMLSWSSCDFSLSLSSYFFFPFDIWGQSHLISQDGEKRPKETLEKKENSDSSKTCSFCSLWRTPTPVHSSSFLPFRPIFFFFFFLLPSFLFSATGPISDSLSLLQSSSVFLVSFRWLVYIHFVYTILDYTAVSGPRDCDGKPFLALYCSIFSRLVFVHDVWYIYNPPAPIIFVNFYFSLLFIYFAGLFWNEPSPENNIVHLLSKFFPSVRAVVHPFVWRAHRSNQVNKQTRRFLFFLNKIFD